MKWDAAQTCVHSLLKCGDCRALEPKQVGPTHAELAREVDELRAKLAALHGGGNGAIMKWRAPTASGAMQCELAAGHAGDHEFRAPYQIPPAAPATPLKLDLGCGTRKQPGFHGVDVRLFEGVDTVCDLGSAPWPWPDGSARRSPAHVRRSCRSGR